MERLDFLKKGFGFMGMALVAPGILKKAAGAESCTAAASETAGPFPTINPSTLVMSNIVGDRTGVAFTINIVVKNVNNNCDSLPGVIVDIWHCDKDGNYSEYGGTGMQQTDYTAKHFLRGRQTTDSSGKVTYTSIFPGWYQGRATHIHVHVYNAAGTSLAITQIAFPEGTGSAVETVNADAAAGYTKGMSGYTYNASDNVFSDGTSTEMSTVSGNTTSGYTLNWDCYVSAPVGTGVNDISAETQFQLRQNFPNPAGEATKVPLVLRTPSDVKLSLLNMEGKEIKTFSYGTMLAGEQVIDVDLAGLAAGRYIYSVKISNASGTFRQSKAFMKN